MAPKKAATRKAPARAAASKKPSPAQDTTKKAPPKKLPTKTAGPAPTTGSGATDNDGALVSPTNSVGPTWDSPLRGLPDAVKTAIENGPLGGINNTPIHFQNPSNYCYRNAMVTMLMYTPQLLGYIQRWHMQMEFAGHKYQDHILQALDNLALAYHSTGPTRAKDTEAAMHNLWQLFRGKSSVLKYDAAVPEPEDGEQEDSIEFLQLMLSEIENQLTNGWIPGTDDETQSIFQAMLKSSLTLRTRCPGTQDGLCPNPDQKQRRQLEESQIFQVKIPKAKEDLSLRDCIAETLRDRSQRWCDDCTAQMRHANADTKNRDSKEWKHVRDCPEVLLMQLQRFQQVPTAKGLRDEKVLTPVTIPETLDLSEFLEYHSYAKGSVIQYELKAVVSHIGNNIGKGHYVAHVKAGKTWWRVDDLDDSKNVTPSSIDRINSDGGGRTGTALKGKSYPYLLSWVKVKEAVVIPTSASEKASIGPRPDTDMGPGKAPKAKKEEKLAKDEGEKGKELSASKDPKNGTGKVASPKTPVRKLPPAGADDDDDEDDDMESPAAKGRCKIWVILNLGGEEEIIAFRKTKANISLDVSKDFPFSGDVRIVDDQGNLFSWDFANPQGIAQHDAVKTGSPKVPRKAKKDKTSAPLPEKTAGTKRKQPEPEPEPEPEDETYVDPTDNTYIGPGDAKKQKTEFSSPKPVRKRGRLMRGSKPGKSVSGDEEEESSGKSKK